MLKDSQSRWPQKSRRNETKAGFSMGRVCSAAAVSSVSSQVRSVLQRLRAGHTGAIIKNQVGVFDAVEQMSILWSSGVISLSATAIKTQT